MEFGRTKENTKLDRIFKKETVLANEAANVYKVFSRQQKMFQYVPLEGTDHQGWFKRGMDNGCMVVDSDPLSDLLLMSNAFWM